MARAPLTDAPSKVYAGMLIVTAVAMLMGVICLALEAGEYDWEQKPPTTQSPAPLPPPNTGTGGSTWLNVPTSPVAAAPELPPPVLPPVAAAPQPIVAAAPKPEESKPAELKPEASAPLLKPGEPIPSPLIIR